MFFLSLIEHTLRLSPHLLDLPLSEAIKGELESLFLDKVVANLGLCIFVNDIRSIDGGFVFPGDSASTCILKSKIWFSYFIYLGLCHAYIFCCRKR
ncbi:hypothetical protein CK203_006849 [Vitis vinifera]|uniref:DNA-directed RNA polymerase subunit n=1 Tax=Vitis vinifera TaxID=29760 RepID=A0A438KCV6_VITVI|nr:hypothetical protein CK203_006849 [Vitis vinifera]